MIRLFYCEVRYSNSMPETRLLLSKEDILNIIEFVSDKEIGTSLKDKLEEVRLLF